MSDISFLLFYIEKETDEEMKEETKEEINEETDEETEEETEETINSWVDDYMYGVYNIPGIVDNPKHCLWALQRIVYTEMRVYQKICYEMNHRHRGDLSDEKLEDWDDVNLETDFELDLYENLTSGDSLSEHKKLESICDNALNILFREDLINRLFDVNNHRYALLMLSPDKEYLGHIYIWKTRMPNPYDDVIEQYFQNSKVLYFQGIRSSMKESYYVENRVKNKGQLFLSAMCQLADEHDLQLLKVAAPPIGAMGYILTDKCKIPLNGEGSFEPSKVICRLNKKFTILSSEDFKIFYDITRAYLSEIY